MYVIQKVESAEVQGDSRHVATRLGAFCFLARCDSSCIPMPLALALGEAHSGCWGICRSGLMIRGALIRPVVVGLTSFGVIFQALLLSVHLSLMAVPQSDIGSVAFKVMCSEHASPDLPTENAPADNPSTCSLCLFCSKSATGGLALLPQAAVLSVVAPSRVFSIPVTSHRLVTRYSPHPPSRGPPAFA
jgi:Protein of unknown function (DUF2946)